MSGRQQTVNSARVKTDTPRVMRCTKVLKRQADEEGDGDGDVDSSDGNSSTQAKPNGVHTNPRAVCVCV